MDKKNFRVGRDRLFCIVGCGTAIFAFWVLLTFNVIGYSVMSRCQMAQDRYGGDCVEALISHLDDDKNSFRSRNSAIWALGQLGDARAVPALMSYRVPTDANRENLDAGISQYELEKAIRLAEGHLNVTAFFWR